MHLDTYREYITKDMTRKVKMTIIWNVGGIRFRVARDNDLVVEVPPQDEGIAMHMLLR
jgi:hypothetical protein